MKILALSTDEELNRLRRSVLIAAGHTVTIVNTEKEAIAAVEETDEYDVVLLCHRLPASAGRQVVRLLRQRASSTKLIYISHIYGEWPEVEADRYVVGADGPEALTRILEEVVAAA